MATLVGELALAWKHGRAPREKSFCAIRPLSQVQVRIGFRTSGVCGKEIGFGLNSIRRASLCLNLATRATMGKHMFKYTGEFQGFVEEVRFQFMRLHAKEQVQQSVEEYLKFLVNSKKVYETLETIVTNSSHPAYESFRNTSFVRAIRLARELGWLSSQGHTIPKPGPAGLSYSNYLMELSQTNRPAFISHLRNVYFGGDQFLVQKGFAGVAGGRLVSETVQKKVSESFSHWTMTGRLLLIWIASVCVALWAGGTI